LLRHSTQENDPDQQGLLEMMEHQVGTLSRLVDDLMDVTRISRGKIELRKQPVELTRIVDRAVKSTRPLIEQRRHTLSVKLPSVPLIFQADPTRLEQVLCNLLNNAANYTDRGGRISLAAEAVRGEIIIRVCDSGVGIEPGMIPKLFDLFSQVEDPRNRAKGGLGIGLSLVRSLVELHGGSISARSKGMGQGSEFIVRLPTSEHSSASTSFRTKHKLDLVKPPSRRVLVVDDNVDAARSLTKVLTLLYGQEVQMAHDGPTAISTAESFRPEIILLDIGLPGMSGHEVASDIRKRPWCKSCRIVAVTGWGQEKDREKSRAAGFDLHLVKPVNPATIGDLLNGDLQPAP
jgi:CheY-like chemotaxis protein